MARHSELFPYPVLEYPVVEIPSNDPNREPSEDYFKAVAIIEEAIAKSEADNLPVYIVEVSTKETHLHPAEKITITLSQFLAGHLSHMVSRQEYTMLLNMYSNTNSTYQDRNNKGPIESEVFDTDNSVEYHMGRTAAESYKPPRFESGPRTYQDASSAAAGDNSHW